MFIENRIIRCHPLCHPHHAANRHFYPLLADSSWRPAGPAVATALFALSLPMRGLWWLGKRSVTPLPPSILNWFYEVRAVNCRRRGRRWHRSKASPIIRRWLTRLSALQTTG
ncbi:DUF412 family protein [Klebsiella pneumoniae subsp. pneumoniae]|nr:DUF412 family protein [Klebsiella pneumoniae subsp. pneumoniae]